MKRILDTVKVCIPCSRYFVFADTHQPYCLLYHLTVSPTRKAEREQSIPVGWIKGLVQNSKNITE